MAEPLKIPTFATEAEEADWWDNHRDLVSEEFEKAAAEGRLRRGVTVPKAMAADMGLNLTSEDIRKAKAAAERKGLSFQAYLSGLVHEALEREPAA